ncbi:MAG TPA: zf-HC2 domain-containing protein [Gemmatimonadaceae bacterium]|nr:zf-HC2 domain-containing protein [Gemmatimonadaceae bacterium]
MTNRPFTCEQFDASLSEYLESALDPAERTALESHAATCGRCRALLAELSAITTEAAALADLEPSRDLWPAIAQRISAPVVALPNAAVRRERQTSVRPWYLAPASLAAAAAVLIAATASVTVLATRSGRAPAPIGRVAANNPVPAAQPIDSQIDIPAPAPRVTNASAFRSNAVPVQEVYAREIAELDSIVRDRRSHLDSSTVAVIEKNLHIIDQAIAQSRAALARDPNSGFLHHQLNDALNQKISLLRTVALLPART